MLAEVSEGGLQDLEVELQVVFEEVTEVIVRLGKIISAMDRLEVKLNACKEALYSGSDAQDRNSTAESME